MEANIKLMLIGLIDNVICPDVYLQEEELLPNYPCMEYEEP